MKIKNKILIPLVLAATIFGAAVATFDFAQADPIKQISVSAYLINSQNKEVDNGDYEVRFAIYKTDRAETDLYPSNADSASKVWEETQKVKIINGIISAYLGSVVPFPDTLSFNDGDYFLGIRVGTDSEMIPRKKIAAAPTAVNSLFLRGATIGTEAGNIPVLGSGGKLDAKIVPKVASLGTVSSGAWEGDVIETAYGGTNASTLGSAGSIAYSTGTAYGFSDAGTAGQILLSGGSGTPIWGTVTGGVITPDSLDFTELADSMTLDANLAISASANNYSINFDSNTLFLDTENNRVGIGTTSPGAALDVAGKIYLNDGSANIVIGDSTTFSSNTTGNMNVAIGQFALKSNTTGTTSTALGYTALMDSTGTENTAVGYAAMRNSTSGNYNTAIGKWTLVYNQGERNTALGHRALVSNTTGYRNTSVGYSSGAANTTGNENIFIGQQAGVNNISGSSNVFAGTYSGWSTTTGSYNVFLGRDSGRNNIGSSNVFLGYGAGYNETGSNKLYIESSTSSTPLVYGDFANDIFAVNGSVGIGTAGPGQLLHLNNSSGDTAIRFQTQINQSASSGPNNGATFTDDSSIGTESWWEPSNSQTSNDIHATAGLMADYQSHYLKATNFGFSIPAGATVEGIKVEVEKKTGMGGTTHIKDNSVKIVKGGVISGNDKADTSTYWPGSDAYKDYGGASDLWGLSWNPADINASDFGVVISAIAEQTEFAMIDHIRVTVYYSQSSAVNWALGEDYSESGNFKLSGSGALGTDDYLTVSSSGYVGIGTTIPVNKLVVSGGMSVGANYNSAAPANGIIIEGNVGIGTTATSQELDLVGDLKLEDTTSDDTGVIYKGTYRFIHNFKHPTGDTMAPVGANTFVGVNAGNFTMGSTATQPFQGSYNSVMGQFALYSNTTGHSNSAVGNSSLYSNTTGFDNSAMGVDALLQNTTGYNNSAMGSHALYKNTTGNYNSAIGSQALYSNATGNYNSAMGSQALYSNTAGSKNTAIGYGTGISTTGSNNLYVGYQAGDNITSGTNNIIIGYDIDAPMDAGSNQLSIGNLIFGTGIDGANKTISSGNVGIGTASPTGKLAITQTATATGALKGIVYTGAVNTNQTLSTEIPSLTLTTAGRQWATGALATQREVLITAPTYSFVGASTITNAATLAIAGAPIKSTNATITNTHGLLIQAGAVSTATNSYGLTVNAQTGATNNYSAAFLGGNVGIGTSTPRTRLELGNDGAILAIGTYNSGWTEPNLGAGTRMLWYPRKAAFRAGYVNGTQWDDANIGAYSTAMGYNATASGNGFFGGATAFGVNTTASGDTSFAVGFNNIASGDYSIALGVNTRASGGTSFAAGYNTIASGDYSTAMGYYTTASGNYSTTIGTYLMAGTAADSMVFGQGVDDTNRLVNNTASSLMVGFNSTIPTLFVGPSAGAGTTGNVGIGTTNPGGGTGSSVLTLADSSAPPTALAGTTHLYSSSGEGYWMDAAGNTTLQTPHDSETGEWIFSSVNVNTEKTLRVEMERLTKEMDAILGGGYVFENGEPYSTGNSLLEAISLKTDQNITTLEELQKSVDEELAKISNSQFLISNEIANINGQIAAVNSQLTTNNQQLTDHETRIKSIEDLAVAMQVQIDELKKLANQELNLAQIEQSKNDIDYLKLVLGLDRAENGSVHLLGNLEADGIVAGAFTVKIVDEEKKTIGTAVIKAITKDEDGDGIDDETGSDGKSVVVKTKAVTGDSKIFATPERPVEVGANSVQKGESFKIEISQPAEDDLKVNWWIVESH